MQVSLATSPLVQPCLTPPSWFHFPEWVGLNQNFLRAVSRQVKVLSHLTPAFSLNSFSPLYLCRRVLPKDRCGWGWPGPSLAALDPAAYSPGRWLFGRCLRTREVPESPRESRLGSAPPAVRAPALTSGFAAWLPAIWLNGKARGSLGK